MLCRKYIKKLFNITFLFPLPTMLDFIKEDQLCYEQPFSVILAGGRQMGETYFTKTLLERNCDFLPSNNDLHC